MAFNGTVGAGECVRILTGAPVPRGANAVVMHEFTRSEGDLVVLEQAVRTGQNFVLAGAEARVGEVMVARGARLGYAELAMAAEVGHARLEVSRRPRVAILSTGDELVSLVRRLGSFRFATATIFHWLRRWRSRAASRYRQAMRRTKSPNFARELKKASMRIFSF